MNRRPGRENGRRQISSGLVLSRPFSKVGDRRMQRETIGIPLLGLVSLATETPIILDNIFEIDPDV